MKISDAFKKLLVEETNFAIKSMEKNENGMQLLYYFSAIPGVINRIYNIEYDSHLVFAHFILKATHDAFIQRITTNQQSGDMTVLIEDNQFERIISLSKEFLRKIKKDEDIDEVLKKFTVLLYSTTGHGNYLMKKGWLKIYNKGSS